VGSRGSDHKEKVCNERVARKHNLPYLLNINANCSTRERKRQKGSWSLSRREQEEPTQDCHEPRGIPSKTRPSLLKVGRKQRKTGGEEHCVLNIYCTRN